jgi:hypothetical protein
MRGILDEANPRLMVIACEVCVELLDLGRPKAVVIANQQSCGNTTERVEYTENMTGLRSSRRIVMLSTWERSPWLPFLGRIVAEVCDEL